MVNNEVKAMDKKLKEFNKSYKEDMIYIQKTISEDSEFGRFALHLLTTERNSSFIINSDYYKDDANNFADLLRNIHHALMDDGEITFYLVDDVPRFSLEYNFDINNCLLSIEKKLSEDLKDTIECQYNCKILNVSIDDWIKLSEEYHIKNLKEMFLFDMELEHDSLEYYRKYKDFNENWIKEIKCN